MSCTLNGTRPNPSALIAAGVANAPAPRLTGAKELLKTLMLPVPAWLAAYNGEAAVVGPRRRYLDKGRGACVPGGDRAVQVRKDEVRGTAVPPHSHREARGAGVLIADLTATMRSIGAAEADVGRSQ